MQENPFKKAKKNYCTFYIVRHGETKWNAEMKVQGQEDSPLTEKGISQVKETAMVLKNVKFFKVYSSDLLRAQKTAKILLLERELAIETTRLLRERKYAEFEGKPIETLDEAYKTYDSLTHEEKLKFRVSQNTESDEEMIGRFITFLRETAVIYPGKNILVATHGGMLKVLLVHLGFGTYENLYVRTIANGAYIKLLSDGVEFFIEETRGVRKEHI